MTLTLKPSNLYISIYSTALTFNVHYVVYYLH